MNRYPRNGQAAQRSKTLEQIANATRSRVFSCSYNDLLKSAFYRHLPISQGKMISPRVCFDNSAISISSSEMPPINIGCQSLAGKIGQMSDQEQLLKLYHYTTQNGTGTSVLLPTESVRSRTGDSCCCAREGEWVTAEK